jgi:hypothetical protein
MWLYVSGGDDEYNMILGRLWMDRNYVTLNSVKKSIHIKSSGI